MLRFAVAAVLAVLSSACGGGERSSTTPTVPRDKPFARVVTVSTGERPAPHDLAPRTAKVHIEMLPAAGGVADQIFVHWQRETRAHVGTRAERLEGTQGVLLWQGRGGGPTVAWRVVYARRYPWYLTVRYQISDVTRDGQADVLVDATMGSAGCGSFRLIATVAGKTREILVRQDCEIGMHIGTRRARAESGDLFIREPVGRCPYPDPSAHCFGGWRQTTERWNGRRSVTVDASVECVLPRLDPHRGCRPRR